MSSTWNWTAPALRRIDAGPGSLSRLPDICRELGIKKPLIVTGQSISRSGIVDQVRKLLPELAGVQDAIGQHAPIEGIHEGVQILRDAQGDGLIAIGGGSPIDAAKAIIHFHAEKTGSEPLKLISVPTTLSAAEMTFASGYTGTLRFPRASGDLTRIAQRIRRRSY
jgi:alcohol dehydrogenase class IV